MSSASENIMTKLDDFAPPGPQDGSYPSTRSSSLQSEDSQINKNNSTSSKNTSSMLSVDFASPLVGTARAERIKMMTSGHKAFDESRAIQEVLCNIQTSLRRMPGVSAQESAQVISELQQVGQVISQETSSLVLAIANLELDLEDSKRVNVRLSIAEKLAGANGDDKDKQLKDLKAELELEIQKREAAEGEVKKVMEDLTRLSADFKALKSKDGQKENHSAGQDNLVRSLEETIKHLEEQVNNRRSLWVMKHSDPQALARAIESLAGSEHTQEVTRKAIASLTRSSEPLVSTPRMNNSHQDNGVSLRGWEESTGSPNGAHGYQQSLMQGSSTSSKFSQMSAGFQPPPSRMQGGGSWGGSSRGRALSYNQPIQPPNGFGRPQNRGGYQAGSGRYRNAVSDFNSNPFGSSEGTSNRPSSAFQYGRDQQVLPSTPNRTNKYTRHQNSGSAQWGGNQQLVPHTPLGPLIHMTEASVNAWNVQVMDFYASIRNFVERNASMPDYSSLVGLTRTPLWPILLATYHPLSENEATSYLDFHLKEESSKSCLVTRVIIDYVVNRVWVPAAWVGSDRESTIDLMRLEDDLEATAGQPSMLRQPLLDRQAAIVDRIMSQRDKDSDFYKHKVEEITASIMQSLHPLLNKMVVQSEAYADMQLVAESAWDLSSKILTSRLTFDFRFPEIGSRFSSQSMLPIWPPIDPMELQAKHWRVALVTTPVITCRNDTGTNISAHSVALADVVCMQ